MQATHYEHVQDKDSVIETRFEYDITKLIKTWHYIYITWTFFYAKWVIMIKGVKVSQLQLLLLLFVLQMAERERKGEGS